MNIGIISLGLIGGSILKALSGKGHNLFVVTGNINTIEKSKTYNTALSSCDLSILNVCDVVFTASPIDKTVEILDNLENIVSCNCIVLDCASIKEFVMKKKRPYKFIGSHPMAGTEFSGFDASSETLFNGAKWVLTPADNVKKDDIDIVTGIISQMGAQVVQTDAKKHDEAVALISHMPIILAQALFLASTENELAMKLASSGFRDMTRLAASNLDMAESLKQYNSENIDKALKKLNSSIDFLLNTDNPQIFSDIKKTRLNMYSENGKNIL